MPTLPVEVHSQGRLVARHRRPLRRTPDGRLGVLFEGVVYPLVHNERIDTDGLWFYASDCPQLLEVPDELERALLGDSDQRWHLDTSGYFSYVMLNGDTVLRDAAIAALTQGGFAVARAAPSFREATNGRSYDWFIRLDTDEGPKPSRWEIAETLDPIWSSAAAGAAAAETRLPDAFDQIKARLAAVSAQVAAWQERVATAEREQARLDEEAASLRQALADSDRKSARERAALTDQVALLRTAVEEYRRQIASRESGSVAIAEELERLRQDHLALSEERVLLSSKIQELETDFAEALASWQQADERVAVLHQTVAAERRRAEDLEAELSDLQEEARRGRQAVGRGSVKRTRLEDLAALSSTFCSNITFVTGALDFMAVEVPDCSSVFRLLHQLQMDPVSMPSKRVHAADDWLECHFSTGLANDGRLYYRRSRAQDGVAGYQVLVSDKAAQARDIERLKKL